MAGRVGVLGIPEMFQDTGIRVPGFIFDVPIDNEQSLEEREMPEPPNFEDEDLVSEEDM